MNIKNNLTEYDIDIIDIKAQLEHQIQNQQTRESGWIFDKYNSMKIRFYKSVELNGSSYVKVLWRWNALKKLKMIINFVSFGQY